jgi:hypothetical protein
VHEIDWALFEFQPARCPDRNRIDNGHRFGPANSPHYPVSVAPASELSGLQVHCMARTSGLQSGRILHGMAIVKIFGRQTPSSSFQVAGTGKGRLGLGVPGDSGAWVVDNEQGRACGHVLAWSDRKRVAYICPMDVSLRDIADTLNATSISFPGGGELLYSAAAAPHAAEGSTSTELENLMHDLALPPTRMEIDGVSPSPTAFEGGEGAHSPASTDTAIELHLDSSTSIPIRLMAQPQPQPQSQTDELELKTVKMPVLVPIPGHQQQQQLAFASKPAAVHMEKQNWNSAAHADCADSITVRAGEVDGPDVDVC